MYIIFKSAIEPINDWFDWFDETESKWVKFKVKNINMEDSVIKKISDPWTAHQNL